jgi:glycosyltransferase involved in cell wall biosynthesis
MKIIVLDPGMRKLAGHHHMWNTALRKAFTERGLEYEFLFHRLAHPELAGYYPEARAHFVFDLYRRLSEEPGNAGPLLTHAEYMRKDLENLTPPPEAQTLLFGHTLDAPAILGIALWYNGLAPEKRPLLALNAHFNFALPTSLTRQIYARTARIFGKTNRVRWFGVADHMAELLTRAGRPARLLPPPFPVPDPACPAATGFQGLPPARNGEIRPIFGFAGEARRERNIELLPAALEHYLTQGGRGNFLLHFAHPDAEVYRIIEQLDALADVYPGRIGLVVQSLREQDYYALLLKFNALLLPFSPQVYHHYRPSQVLQEAFYLGIPAIVGSGGYMEHETEKIRGGSLVMRENSARGLSAALFEFEQNPEERLALARAVSGPYRRANNINAAMDCLLDT